MKDGRISEQGTYHQLLVEEGEFADFLVNYLTEEGEKELDPQTESELEDLKTELENALGKEKDFKWGHEKRIGKSKMLV